MSVNDKTSNPVGYSTFKAAGDIEAYRFVGFNNDYPSSETKTLGVVESKFVANEIASAVVLGIAVVETSVAVNRGDKLTCDIEGRAKKATSGMIVNGRSLDTVSEPGFVRILLTT